MGKKAQRENEAAITSATDTQTREMKEWQAKQSGALAQQKQKYREFEFTNPMAGMENAYEDMEVSTEAARFQMEQGSQQRANIMSGLKGAAGSSGVAGLAQALAGQGVMQARQVSTDISQQEMQNSKMKAQGAQQVDQMQRQGAAMVQQQEFGRESTLYAAELGEMAGARGGVQGAFGNQMAGLSAISQMDSARMQMWGNLAGDVVGAFNPAG